MGPKYSWWQAIGALREHLHKKRTQSLRVACQEGNLAHATRLLAQGADPNTEDGLPLWAAVVSGHAQITHMLLAHGADATSGKNALLYWAVQHNDAVVLATLLAAVPDHKQADVRNSILLIEAAQNNDIACCKILLDYGVDPTKNHSGALIWSAYHQNQELCDLLFPMSDATDALARMELLANMNDENRKMIADRLQLKDALSQNALLHNTTEDNTAPLRPVRRM